MTTSNSATIIKAIKSLADDLGATFHEKRFTVSVTINPSKVFCTGGKNVISYHYAISTTPHPEVTPNLHGVEQVLFRFKASALNRLLKDLKNGVKSVTNIITTKTEDTGGGVIVDYLTMTNGQVLAIGIDSATLYGSEDKAFNEPEDYLSVIELTNEPVYFSSQERR